MNAFNKKGQVSSPANPGDSKIMLWIRDFALPYEGDDCLPWPFGKHPSGYGYVTRNGKTTTAHRYICEWVHGMPPTPAYQAAHSCGNGHLGCMNPRHLIWKTVAENEADKGPRRERWKLTPETVVQIRGMIGEDNVGAVASRFGVSERTIRSVWAGETWTTGTYNPGGFAKTPWTNERRAEYAALTPAPIPNPHESQKP